MKLNVSMLDVNMVNMMKKKSKRGKILKILIPIFSVILICFISFFIYAEIYYHADESVDTALKSSTLLTVEENKNDIEFTPVLNTSKSGVIFYPGGKVEEEAYAPLINKLSKTGVYCVIVRMPFRLAVLGSNRADSIIKNHSEIENWYIAGHSLGGAMAASYASKNQDKIEGLILLGAYSTKSVKDISVLSIKGSEDKVLNLDKYEKYHDNLPDDVIEVTLEGGCHSYYGNYGNQKGDGEATITREKQQNLTVSYIRGFILKENWS